MGEGMLSRVDALPAAVTRLTVAALTGDTTLTVGDASSFTPGIVDVDGTPVEVTAADEGTTLTVVALTADLDVDSPVVLLNTDGDPVTRLWATVDVPDSDAESGVFPLLTGLEWALPEQSYDPPIPVEVGIVNGEEVVWLPGQARMLDPDTIDDPYCFGTILTDVTVPDATWTTLTGFNPVFELDFYRDPAYPGHIFAKKSGVYIVGIAGQWFQNSIGRRAIKSVRHTILGTFDNEPPDSRGAESTAAMTTEANRTIPVARGDHISFEVLQTSGADLDLIGGSITFSIARVGSGS